MDVNGEETLQYDLVSMVANVGLRAFDFKSITAYQSHSYRQLYDNDYSNLPTMVQGNPEDVDAFSQELRLTSKGEGTRWIAGALYYYQKTDNRFQTILDDEMIDFFLNALGTPTAVTDALTFGETTATGITELDSYALYGNVEFNLSKSLTLNLGGRYTYEQKSIDYVQTSTNGNIAVLKLPALPREYSEDSWNAFTPTATLNWQAGNTTMLYATASQGFKSGGFNDGFGAEPSLAFGPEKLWNYELGIKGGVWNGRVQYSAAAFAMEWSDVQDRRIILQDVGGLSTALVVIDTLGDAEITGFEGQVTTLLTNNLWLDVAVGFTDGEWKNVAAESGLEEGQAFANVPDAEYSVGLQYSVPFGGVGDLVLRADANYRAETPLGGSTAAIISSQPAFTLINGGVTFEMRSGWSVGAWVKNLTDEEYIVAIHNSAENNPLIGSRFHLLGDPMTWGLEVRYRF